MSAPDASPRAIRQSYRAAGNCLTLPLPRWDSSFLRACRGEPTAQIPVWLMRQAGRYMQHYRGIRARGSFLDLCKDPAAAAEVTVYAREWLGVDAAIIFSDILIVLEALGLHLDYHAGDGPQVQRIDSAAMVDGLRDPLQAAADLGYVDQALRLTTAALPANIPCIGFCGAPFTLAAYALEGGSSRQFTRTRTFMYRETPAWHRLCARLVDTLVPFLRAQIAAGASAVQIFDSWVGQLTTADFAEFVQPHLTRLIAEVPAGIPVILFGTATGHLLPQLAACGADVLGLDSCVHLGDAWRSIGGPARIAVQGNLDPAVLLAPTSRLTSATQQVIAQSAGQPGFIFNLGHGVLKETDPAAAKTLVDLVHAAR